MSYTLHHGDAFTVLSRLTDEVDAVITDPPYSSGGMTVTQRSSSTARKKYVSSNAQHELPDFPGDQRDQRGYLAWLTLILSQCLRLTRSGGPLLVFSDWRQLPITSDALQAAGWTWRGIVPWRKPIARPAKGGFRRSCEYVLWGTNGPVDAARNPIYLDGFVTGSQPRGRQRKHITQKPLEVVRELVKICAPGGTILDPFAGSGTTGEAALAEGHPFIGIELSATYHAIAEQRIRQAALTQGDFDLAAPEDS